jgi:hypothetical protein
MFVALALVLASSMPASSAPAGAPFVAGETLRFESARMGGPREIVVRVPRGTAGARHPVVYVLDGGEGFLPASAAAGFLAAHLSMPDVIVVAIRHADRGYELTPAPAAPGPVPGVPRPGGADALLAHLAEEVVPLVESRYPTQPHRTLVGHSLGGLFAAHALVTRPALFQGYVLLDPALWWDGGRVARRFEAFFRDRPDVRARIAIVESRGAGGDGPADPKLPGVRFRRVVVDGESHETLAYRGIYEGLRALFSDYPPAYRRDADAATPAALEAQYAALSRDLGFPVAVPAEARAEVDARVSARAARSAASVPAGPPISAAAAAPYVGRWEGTVRTVPGTPVRVTLTFAFVGGSITGTGVAHGVAMDGGDFTTRASAVRVTNDGLEWERENRGGGTYVSRARIGADGALEGTEELRGGPAPPPGFVPPAVTFTFVRAPSP